MRQFYFHVQFTDNEGVDRFRSIQFSARDMFQAHYAGRKLVTLLCCDPIVKEINAYYLEQLKIG
jgi:hypothetical protein